MASEIIDGYDNTGKTSTYLLLVGLVEGLENVERHLAELAKMFRNKWVEVPRYFHVTKPLLHSDGTGGDVFRFYAQQLFLAENVWFDRSFISEVVYGTVHNGGCRLSRDEFLYLVALCKWRNIGITILFEDVDTIKKRWKSEEMYEFDAVKVEDAQNLYSLIDDWLLDNAGVLQDMGDFEYRSGGGYSGIGYNDLFRSCRWNFTDADWFDLVKWRV